MTLSSKVSKILKEEDDEEVVVDEDFSETEEVAEQNRLAREREKEGKEGFAISDKEIQEKYVEAQELAEQSGEMTDAGLKNLIELENLYSQVKFLNAYMGVRRSPSAEDGFRITSSSKKTMSKGSGSLFPNISGTKDAERLIQFMEGLNQLPRGKLFDDRLLIDDLKSFLNKPDDFESNGKTVTEVKDRLKEMAEGTADFSTRPFADGTIRGIDATRLALQKAFNRKFLSKRGKNRKKKVFADLENFLQTGKTPTRGVEVKLAKLSTYMANNDEADELIKTYLNEISTRATPASLVEEIKLKLFQELGTTIRGGEKEITTYLKTKIPKDILQEVEKKYKEEELPRLEKRLEELKKVLLEKEKDKSKKIDVPSINLDNELLEEQIEEHKQRIKELEEEKKKAVSASSRLLTQQERAVQRLQQKYDNFVRENSPKKLNQEYSKQIQEVENKIEERRDAVLAIKQKQTAAKRDSKEYSAEERKEDDNKVQQLNQQIREERKKLNLLEEDKKKIFGSFNRKLKRLEEKVNQLRDTYNIETTFGQEAPAFVRNPNISEEAVIDTKINTLRSLISQKRKRIVSIDDNASIQQSINVTKETIEDVKQGRYNEGHINILRTVYLERYVGEQKKEGMEEKTKSLNEKIESLRKNQVVFSNVKDASLQLYNQKDRVFAMSRTADRNRNGSNRNVELYDKSIDAIQKFTEALVLVEDVHAETGKLVNSYESVDAYLEEMMSKLSSKLKIGEKPTELEETTEEIDETMARNQFRMRKVNRFKSRLEEAVKEFMEKANEFEQLLDSAEEEEISRTQRSIAEFGRGAGDEEE